MNKLGAAGHAVRGSWVSPDPAEETTALERANGNGHGNGHDDIGGVPEEERSSPKEITTGH
jgi:ubiquinol-cytochrome c reductase cytochrome b subunit